MVLGQARLSPLLITGLSVLAAFLMIGGTIVGTYYASREGTKVALAETRMRLDFHEEKIGGFKRDIERMSRDLTLVKYDNWSNDGDIANLCKKVEIDRMPRRYPNDG
jgi:uncharacterized protein (DUF2252 family)